MVEVCLEILRSSCLESRKVMSCRIFDILQTRIITKRQPVNTEVTDKQLSRKPASIMEHWPCGHGTEFPIQGSQAQNQWMTQLFIFLRSIKWAPGSFGDLLFLTAIWLSHGQLWAILKRTSSSIVTEVNKTVFL